MKTLAVVIGMAALNATSLCVASVNAQTKSPFATKVVASFTNHNAGGGNFLRGQVRIAKQDRHVADKRRDGNVGNHVPQVTVAEGRYLFVQH